MYNALSFKITTKNIFLGGEESLWNILHFFKVLVKCKSVKISQLKNIELNHVQDKIDYFKVKYFSF